LTVSGSSNQSFEYLARPIRIDISHSALMLPRVNCLKNQIEQRGPSYRRASSFTMGRLNTSSYWLISTHPTPSLSGRPLIHLQMPQHRLDWSIALYAVSHSFCDCGLAGANHASMRPNTASRFVQPDTHLFTPGMCAIPANLCSKPQLPCRFTPTRPRTSFLQ
jgi:hypothetical protein